MIKIRLSLPCPVNRKDMPLNRRVRGRMIPMKVLTPEYRQKRQRLVAEVWDQIGGRPKEPMKGSVQVFMVMTPRDKRTADCDAYWKCLLDGLAMAGVYLDDKQVVHHGGERLPNPVHPGWLDVTVEELP